MVNEVQASLITDDEYALLLIMQEGQSVAAIGRWEKPLDSLVERGLARRLDKFNNIITTEGRKACGARDLADTTALKSLMPRVADAQERTRQGVEAAAGALYLAAKTAAEVTGDSVETALINLNLEVLRRARELLRGE